jgi:hypothetical protein
MGHMLDEIRPDWICVLDGMYKDIAYEQGPAKVDISERRSYPCIVTRPNGERIRCGSIAKAAKATGLCEQNLGRYLARKGMHISSDGHLIEWEEV